MKKIILLFAAVCNITLMSAQFEGSSQKGKSTMDPNSVPVNARTSFVKENPDVEAGWKMEGKNYKAEYVDEANVAHARVYNPDGALQWRDDEMSAYPPAITDFYNKTYPGEGFMIWSRIDGNGVTTYYAYHNSEMIWFDKNGNHLNPKKSKAKPNEPVKVK